MNRKSSVVLILASLVLSCSAVFSFAQCPSKDVVQKAVEVAFKQNDVKVMNVTQGVVPGLCDVEVEQKGQKRMVYTDSTGQYLIAGQVFKASDGTNITQEAVSNLNRLSVMEIAQLDKIVAFTDGNKGKVVYLVTDPQCPYCQKAEAVLSEMVKKGEVQVKYILMPLPFHKGAKEESISILCDKKGIEGLKSRYRSENQCAEGIKKIDDGIAFLQQKGITATPTYIFTDGRFQSGVLDENQLKQKLK